MKLEKSRALVRSALLVRSARPSVPGAVPPSDVCSRNAACTSWGQAWRTCKAEVKHGSKKECHEPELSDSVYRCHSSV